MSADTRFITNEAGQTLLDRFQILIKDTQLFDVLVGYFYSSGFLALSKSLESTEHIRILIGIGTDQPTLNDVSQSKQLELPCEMSHAEAREAFSGSISHEMDNSEDEQSVEEGVNRFQEWLKSGKLEIKLYPTKDIHAKLYIMTFRRGDKDDGRVITGSSNFTSAGLASNIEFNVELKDHADYQFALDKFNLLWAEAVDVKDVYVDTIQRKTWLNDSITPYELYLSENLIGTGIIKKLHSNEDVQTLIYIVKESKRPRDVRGAIRALGALKAETSVEPIIYCLLNGSFQSTAIQALGDIGSEKAVKPLVLLLYNWDAAPEVKKAILESLGKIASKEAIRTVIGYLDIDEVKEAALDVVVKLGVLAVGDLIDVLDTDLKDGAIKALGQIGKDAKAATVPLLKMLETITDKAATDCNVLTSLALIKDLSSVKPLISLIKYNTAAGDDDYSFQIQIITTLGAISDKQATVPLIHLLIQNTDSLVKEQAATALGKIGDDDAIEPLLVVLENDREKVLTRDVAAWALLHLDKSKIAVPVLRYLIRFHNSLFDSLHHNQ